MSHLSRAFAVLESLEQPKSSAEIARQLDVNRSTALRLLRELEELGYVKRELDTLLFSLDTKKIYRLCAGREVDKGDWRGNFDASLKTIRDEFKEAAILGLPANSVMVYGSYFDCNNFVALREQIGTVRSMHCSALGQAYLSALPEYQLSEVLKEISFDEGTDRAPKNEKQLRERLATTRERGYAIDDEQTFEGGMCVAVPAMVDNKVVGALGLSGPTSRLSKQDLSYVGKRLLEYSHES